jgi:hypothetical protein
VKPIFLKVDEKGKPIVTIEEIQNMVELAYSEGYKDGQKQANTITVPSYDPPNAEWWKETDWWKKVIYTDHTTPLNGYHSDYPRKDIANAMPYNPDAYKVYCSNTGGINSVR